MEQINLARRDAAGAFRVVAAEVEADLRRQIGDEANGALRQSDTPDNRDKDTINALRKKAKKLRETIAVMQDREPGDGPDYIDPAVLEGKLRQLDTMRRALAQDEFQVHEAKVSLLGKTGALGDDEYNAAMDAVHAKLQARADAGETVPEDERRAAFTGELNQAIVLKQLRGPLGGAAFGALISSGKLGEEMERRGLAAGEAGAVDKLRDLLGQEAVERIKGDPDAVARLAEQHDVKRLDYNDLMKGVENLGFELGKATSETMYASQFLQTGGNERQIRAKSAVLRDIEQGGRPPLRATGSKASQEIEAKRQAMAAGGADSEQAAAMRARTPGSPDEARRDELLPAIAEAEAELNRTTDELDDVKEQYGDAKRTAKRLKREIEDASDELERLRKAGGGDDEALRKLAAEVEALDRERKQAKDERDELASRKDDLKQNREDLRERLRVLRRDLDRIARRLDDAREGRADELLEDDPVLGKLELNEDLGELEGDIEDLVEDIKDLESQLSEDKDSKTKRDEAEKLLAEKRGEAEKLRADRERLDQTAALRIPVLRRQLDALVGRIEQASGGDREALVAEAAPLRAEMEKLMAGG